MCYFTDWYFRLPWPPNHIGCTFQGVLLAYDKCICTIICVLLYILSLHNKRRRKPCPLVPSWYNTRSNYLIPFDCIETGLRTPVDKYFFMVINDHSCHCWLFPAIPTDIETAADLLLDWSAAFGVPFQLVSDKPTQFKNETVCPLTKDLHTPHYFTQHFAHSRAARWRDFAEKYCEFLVSCFQNDRWDMKIDLGFINFSNQRSTISDLFKMAMLLPSRHLLPSYHRLI